MEISLTLSLQNHLIVFYQIHSNVLKNTQHSQVDLGHKLEVLLENFTFLGGQLKTLSSPTLKFSWPNMVEDFPRGEKLIHVILANQIDNLPQSSPIFYQKIDGVLSTKNLQVTLTSQQQKHELKKKKHPLPNHSAKTHPQQAGHVKPHPFLQLDVALGSSVCGSLRVNAVQPEMDDPDDTFLSGWFLFVPEQKKQGLHTPVTST